MGNHGELLVKRTKVLYGAMALMLFGALGVGVQISQTNQTVSVVAPALTDACKDYKFYVGHSEACSTAATITSTSSPVPTAPGVAVVVADTGTITSANR